MASRAEEAIEYEPPGDERCLTRKSRRGPWPAQLELDDASYRRQLAYLYEHSPFYRTKLTAAGFAGAEQAGGLDDIARLPLTDKHELRATLHRREPVRHPPLRRRRRRSCASTARAARRACPATSR